MDGDGNKEIAMSYDTQMYLFDKTGTIISGWPKTAGVNPWDSPNLDQFKSQPSFGNVDGGTDLELIALSMHSSANGEYGGIYGWKKNGTLLTGLPKYTNTDSDPNHAGTGRIFWGYSTFNTVSLADVDNDGKDEIAVGAMQDQVYDYTGSALTLKYSENTVYTQNYPVAFPENYVGATAPSIADVDGDGAFDYTTAFGPHIGIMKADGTRSWDNVY